LAFGKRSVKQTQPNRYKGISTGKSVVNFLYEEMEMKEKILCVDDELNILEGYQRALRKEFHIDVAIGGEQGLEAIANRGPYAVIVSDMRMPGMDGIQFLSLVKKLAPNSVRMMLTGNADQQTAIEAVNEGNIFRFLTKPCSPEMLGKALSAGIMQYRLIMAEKELLEKTLSSSIHVLTDILSLVNPTAFGRATRVRRIVKDLVEYMGIDDAWQVDIAAMLSQIGCVTIPEATMSKVFSGTQLSVDEFKILQSHPQVGHDLLSMIPRMEPVAEIIAYQEKRFNGTGLPADDLQGEDIPVGARVLKLALDFDKLLQANLSEVEAFEELERRTGWYDPTAIEALRQTRTKQGDYELTYITLDELAPGMVMAENLLSSRGLLLIAQGQEVTRSVCLKLQNLVGTGGEELVTDSFRVYAPITRISSNDVSILQAQNGE
jgi:response regulator RpfG family c-di-GMP phosphodiesterase